MPRPRKTPSNLPPSVYHHHGAYYLIRAGKWQRLAADLPSALAEYERRKVPALDAIPTGTPALLDQELVIIDASKLAPETRRQYHNAAKKLKYMLQKFRPDQVKPKNIAQIRYAMIETPNSFNHCLSLLRRTFDRALQFGMVNSHPCYGINRLEEARRDRLISSDEFVRIYEKATPRLQAMLGLWFCTGQRVMDVVEIRREHITDRGVYFRQRKTGKQRLVTWTPELRSYVDMALRLQEGRAAALTLFTGERGKRRFQSPPYGSVARDWRAAVKAAGIEGAQCRDLRAMSATAAKEQGLDATALLGHTSAKTTAIYLRDRKVTEVASPVFAKVIAIAKKT